MNPPTSPNQPDVLDDYAAAYAQFLHQYPTFRQTERLDQLRATEYARLDKTGQIYLDYTGGGLYAESQIRQHMEMLTNGVWGNPHSNNPTSLAMTHKVEAARAYVLEFFRADPHEYAAIFTANASNALKLLGESYPFAPGGTYALVYDNHNSVNGIREFAHAKGANVQYIPVTLPELRLPDEVIMRVLDAPATGQPRLLAYPAQSNYSGVQHSLAWIASAQARGWDVLLDAAAFVPTNRLDLSQVHPDFVSLSFYKMFGYPTGVGCLLARKSALAKLHRPWFAGGTVAMVSVQLRAHRLAPFEAGFEDGTVNYLHLPAVEIGLRHLNNIGLELIHERVTCLEGWLLAQLQTLHHDNGQPLVEIFGPTTTLARGGTISISLLDQNDCPFDEQMIEQLATEAHISLRTGCFCNPGAGEMAHHLTSEEILTYYHEGRVMSYLDFQTWVQQQSGKKIGAIRISVGLATTFADVYRFMQFVVSFRNKTTAEVGGNQFCAVHNPLMRDTV